MKADEILREAARIIEERGKLRDLESGERSMLRAVQAYSALTNGKLETELDGWLFMCVLKMARATAGEPHLDDLQDLAGYAALAGECISGESPAAFSLSLGDICLWGVYEVIVLDLDSLRGTAKVCYSDDSDYEMPFPVEIGSLKKLQ